MTTTDYTFLEGEGEMHRRVSQLDWTSTPLGAIENWSDVLAVSVSLCLNSRFPLILWWGPELTMLYNDPYREHLQSKHPVALGQPGQKVWNEIWPVIGPMLDGVMSTGKATWSDDLLLFLERNGFPEETYHTFSYSAIKDRSGQILGIFTPVSETTQRVLYTRRTDTLRIIGSTKSAVESDLRQKLTHALLENRNDLTFFLLFQVNEDKGLQILLRDETLKLSDEDAARVFHKDVMEVVRTESVEIRNDKEVLSACHFKSPQERAVDKYVLAPIAGSQHSDAFVLVAGISPHLPLDDSYLTFIKGLARELTAAIRETRALEQEKQRAQALFELDQAKTIFFNNISHEFRTPLTLMLGPIESLLRSSNQADATELELVHRSSLRLLKLVNTLLDFSRIEAGRYDVHFVPTDLCILTRDLTSLFRSAIEKAGLTLTFECDCEEPAYVDHDMWEHIVLNLLSNAFKFTPKGSITVTLKQTATHFQLSVQDSGVGIADADLSRLFQRFNRFKQEGARSFEGTGIGLAMIKEMVTMHSGTITATSQPGVGTKFLVEIPRGSNHVPASQLTTTRAERHEPRHGTVYVAEALNWAGGEKNGSTEVSSPAVHTANILVVDDNADMRDYIKRMLSQLWSITVATNGIDAIQQLNTSDFDLVITDIMMPDMDGFALLKAIRSLPNSNMPVILLSARAGEEAKAEGIEAGADDYLVKPFSARELFARVSHLLEQRSLTRVLEEAVRERTYELQHAVASKDRFLSTVGHEVRTPLASVIGLIELLTTSAETEDNKMLAEMALNSSKGLLHILNDLLESSRLQAGKVQLKPTNFSPRAVIGDVVQLNQTEAQKNNVELSSNVDSGVPKFLCGDELRIRQVLTNLVHNAVKFTKEGSINLSCQVVEVSGEITRVRFSVADTGIGLSEAEMRHIFDPFTQATASTVHIFGGSGLGLSICKELVELMGGEIGVESKAGEGTTFWVTVPFDGDLCNAKS